MDCLRTYTCKQQLGDLYSERNCLFGLFSKRVDPNIMQVSMTRLIWLEQVKRKNLSHSDKRVTGFMSQWACLGLINYEPSCSCLIYASYLVERWILTWLGRFDEYGWNENDVRDTKICPTLSRRVTGYMKPKDLWPWLPTAQDWVIWYVSHI